MKRREFFAGLGSAAALSLAARAQQSDRLRRIGVLTPDSDKDPQTRLRLAAFQQELERLGWSESRNIQINYRFAGNDPKQYQPLAKDLVSVQPDILLAYTTPIALAFQQESRTIPIVFLSVSDPVGSRLVENLARPGGNLTGLLLYEEGIAGKWLAMLREIAPGLSRAALIANPRRTPFDYYVQSAKRAASSLAFDLEPSPADNADELERVINSFARKPNGGLVVLPGTSNEHQDHVIALAARHRLPAVYYARFFVTAGGLMAYGIDIVDQSREVASYVDRVLRGAKPAGIPVQAPTKYHTILNLKTARALGLDVPPSMLVRADEVIE